MVDDVSRYQPSSDLGEATVSDTLVYQHASSISMTSWSGVNQPVVGRLSFWKRDDVGDAATSDRGRQHELARNWSMCDNDREFQPKCISESTNQHHTVAPAVVVTTMALSNITDGATFQVTPSITTKAVIR